MASKNPMMAWFNVKDGSTLNLKVTASNDRFQMIGEKLEDDVPNKRFRHDEIVPKLTLPLSAPDDRGVSLSITFLGEADTTVDLEGEIGGVKRQAKAWGAQGTVEPILISISY